MNRPSLAIALLLLVAVPAGAAEPRPDAFDIVCLTETRPVVVRLNITVDGKPLADTWTRFADELFAKLDADKSGTLEGKELARLPQTLALLTMRTNFPVPTTRMTRAELGAYLRKNDFGPFRLPTISTIAPSRVRFSRPGPVRQAEAFDKALMELLDTNKDGKLSAAELAAAPALLAKLDADENDLITADELLGQTSALDGFLEERGKLGPPAAPLFEMVLLNRKGSNPVLARQLLERYAPRGKDGAARPKRLTRADLKLSAEAFEALDQDGNDELDAEELSRFTAVPEIELAFHLGTVPQGKRAVEIVTAGKAPVTATARGDGAALELPGMRLDFPAVSIAAPNFRDNYLGLFRAFDADGNGYLDEAEATRAGVFRDLFTLLDADGDGKIFEKELGAALDEVQPLASAARTFVTAEVIDAERGLFGLIDTDGDGQISLRERRAIPTLAQRLGADGAFNPSDILRQFQVTFLSGPSAARAPIRRAPAVPVGSADRRPATGPEWFRKMDRNRDGVVSRREFLGTEEDFRRIDRNGDGLIDPDEAEAASKTEEKK